jgi:hypothetical protein
VRAHGTRCGAQHEVAHTAQARRRVSRAAAGQRQDCKAAPGVGRARASESPALRAERPQQLHEREAAVAIHILQVHHRGRQAAHAVRVEV